MNISVTQYLNKMPGGLRKLEETKCKRCFNRYMSFANSQWQAVILVGWLWSVARGWTLYMWLW